MRIATIGTFDGVHVGHRLVLQCMKQLASEHGCGTVVVTFDRHPRTLFDANYKPRMLNTLDERIEKLKACGIDEVHVLTFDHAMAALSARDFMEKILRDELGVTTLVLGYDNRFGKRNADESFDDYVRYGHELGIEVIRCAPYRLSDGTCVSSTLIRQFIEQGKDITNLI